MSTDPNSGIAYMEAYQQSGRTIGNEVQFSGVLIAPDEILTVAHGVTDPDGSFRNAGSAYLDFNGGLLSNGDPIQNIHVLDNSHPSGAPEGDSQIASDFAVIHLANPVVGAQIFSLGVAAPGDTYQITGYPAIDDGNRVSVTETLSNGNIPGEMFGASLTGTSDASGASGGPVFTTVNGNPTVVGLMTAQDLKGEMSTSALTGADIAQIDAWVYSDDSDTAWGSAFSPTVAASAKSTPSPAPSSSVSFSTPIVQSADELDQLSAMLTYAAPDGGKFSKLMLSAAEALSETREQGDSSSDMPDAAFQAAVDLHHGLSHTPNRAVAYLGGMLAAELCAQSGNVMHYVNHVFGLDVSSSLANVVRQGLNTEHNLECNTICANVPTPHDSLASAIHDLTMSSVYSDHGIHSNADLAPYSLTANHQAAFHFA